MKKLNKKEKAFCKSYLDTGSIFEAERLSGVKDGSKIICKDTVVEEIERLSKLQTKSLNQLAKSGLKKLAMGGISDAVSLIYMDKPDKEVLKNMDLFMISEIRRNKDNCMEIKFFDRFKALDKLIENCDTEENSVPFYDALIKGAMSLERNNNER